MSSLPKRNLKLFYFIFYVNFIKIIFKIYFKVFFLNWCLSAPPAHHLNGAYWRLPRIKC